MIKLTVLEAEKDDWEGGQCDSSLLAALFSQTVARLPPLSSTVTCFQQPGRREGYNWTMSRVHTFTFSDCVENWCFNITDDKKHDFYR